MSMKSKSNLVPLKADFVTPEIVIETLQKNAPELKELFAVGIKKDGKIVIWGSGDLKEMPTASMAFQLQTLDLVRESRE